MVKFLTLVPVLAVLGFAGFAAAPAQAAPATTSIAIQAKDTANVHYTGRWHRHNMMHHGWNNGRHYGWNRNCRTVNKRVWNERRGRWVYKTVRTCR